MASELTVQTIKAPTSGGNANTILVGSGQTLYAPGHVIQIEQAKKTDTQVSQTNHTFLDITGLTITMTPTSASSKFYISFLVRGASNYYTTYVKLLRGVGGSFTALGEDADGAGDSRKRIASSVVDDQTVMNSHGIMQHHNFQILDAPSTAAAVTYKLQMAGRGGGSNLMYVNRTIPDRTSGEYDYRATSYLQVMEIGG